jgi:hypothetical protein
VHKISAEPFSRINPASPFEFLVIAKAQIFMGIFRSPELAFDAEHDLAAILNIGF